MLPPPKTFTISPETLCILGVVFEPLFPVLPTQRESSDYPIQVVVQVQLEVVWSFINHFQVASGELMGH